MVLGLSPRPDSSTRLSISTRYKKTEVEMLLQCSSPYLILFLPRFPSHLELWPSALACLFRPTWPTLHLVTFGVLRITPLTLPRMSCRPDLDRTILYFEHFPHFRGTKQTSEWMDGDVHFFLFLVLFLPSVRACTEMLLK